MLRVNIEVDGLTGSKPSEVEAEFVRLVTPMFSNDVVLQVQSIEAGRTHQRFGDTEPRILDWVAKAVVLISTSEWPPT